MAWVGGSIRGPDRALQCMPLLCRFLRFPLSGCMLQTSLFGLVLICSDPASTVVGVECSFQMLARLTVSTAKVSDTKSG